MFWLQAILPLQEICESGMEGTRCSEWGGQCSSGKLLSLIHCSLRAIYKLNQTLLKLQITELLKWLPWINVGLMWLTSASFSLLCCLMREVWRLSNICSKRSYITFKCIIITSGKVMFLQLSVDHSIPPPRRQTPSLSRHTPPPPPI